MAEVDRLYPYDPNADESALRGPEKLRAVPDRTTAQLLLELWRSAERTDSDPGFAARERARTAEAVRVERERLVGLADASRRGRYGLAGKELWATLTDTGRDTSDNALKELAKALRHGARRA